MAWHDHSAAATRPRTTETAPAPALRKAPLANFHAVASFQRENCRVNEVATPSTTDHALVQTIYGLMRQKGSWPKFTTVDLHADRDLGLEDAQAALVAIPEQLIFRPWHSNGYHDGDEVRLRIPGIKLCNEGPEDLTLLVKLVSWLVDLERTDTRYLEEDLVVTAQAFADHIGLVWNSPRPEWSSQRPKT